VPLEDGGTERLKQGITLPPVVLPASEGSDVCPAMLPGRSVVAVYPWTGRPGQPNPPDWDAIPGAHGSTPELEAFRDLFDDFTKRGVRLFGLSRQTTNYQSEMARRLRLPFPILSDAEARFTAALALPTFATGGESYLKRLTLLIRDGVIESIVYPVLDPARHPGEVLAGLTQNA
jgi:peroxiredoxin